MTSMLYKQITRNKHSLKVADDCIGSLVRHRHRRSLMEISGDSSSSAKVVSIVFCVLISCCVLFFFIRCVIRAKHRRKRARVHFVNQSYGAEAQTHIFTIDSFDKGPPSYESLQHLRSGTSKPICFPSLLVHLGLNEDPPPAPAEQHLPSVRESPLE